MMTTLAALFGALPLALSRGVGAELRRPLGVAIVGGLIVSQALTLFTTPVVYLYLDRLRSWTSRVRTRRPAPAHPGTRCEASMRRVPFLRVLVVALSRRRLLRRPELRPSRRTDVRDVQGGRRVADARSRATTRCAPRGGSSTTTPC